MSEFSNQKTTFAMLDSYAVELNKLDLLACFCHGDANSTNIIYNRKSGKCLN